MASLTVRDIPEPLYRQLKAAAAASHRSLNKEIIARLEATLGARPASVAEELREIRRFRASLGDFRWDDAAIDEGKRWGRE